MTRASRPGAWRARRCWCRARCGRLRGIAQPVPMVERVADRLGQRTASGQPGQLGFEPGAQLRHQRLAFSLTHRQPFGGALAADPRLDLVERGNPLQRFGRDRRLAFGQIIEASAHVAQQKASVTGGSVDLVPPNFL